MTRALCDWILLLLSGEKLLLHLCISAIAVPHPLLLDVLPMNSGISASLILVIFAYGGVVHMFMCKRINKGNLDLIWRSAFSLDILLDTRAGSSTIHTPSELSSLREQSLMNLNFQ